MTTRTKTIRTRVNDVEHAAFEKLMTANARNESEMLRELIRQATIEAGFFSVAPEGKLHSMHGNTSQQGAGLPRESIDSLLSSSNTNGA